MALIRKLLDYQWELRGKKVALVDLKNNNEIVIDKVRLMSFMKFAVNCMDKMRIKNNDMKEMEKLFRKIRKGNGLNNDELNKLIELSSRFLYIAQATLLIRK